MQLPNQKDINIQALSELFKNTHTSYKYLFFQAILSLLNETNFIKVKFSFARLESKMLEIAEYPIKIYRLDFGVDDRVARKLYNKYEKINLLKFVPYRLIAPFFINEIKELSPEATNKKIEKLSNQDTQYRSIYKITEQSITINPEWVIYLKENFTIIESWVFWHWANYLQNKNPNTLALINKLRKPSGRLHLEKQRRYWIVILNQKPFKCIFSGNEITPDTLSIDHFLPWSFIGHDQLWNLMPIQKNDNSVKSDTIPSMDKYLDNFIAIQKMGLEESYNVMGKDQWENSIRDFANDFKIEYSDLRKPNQEQFSNRYKEIIFPLVNIAKNAGFSYDWVY